MPKLLSRQQFIDLARSVHGDLYDYSAVDYVNASTKVNIICPTHGAFLMRPHLHTSNKNKCPKCNIASKTKTNAQFIEECVAVHGRTYDYSNTDYRGINSTVTIGCSVHGMFQQLAYRHLAGFGCPICAKRNNGNYKWSSFKERHPDMMEQDAEMYLMRFVHITSGYIFYKVGVTRNTIATRFRGYLNYDKTIIASVRTSLKDCLQYEQSVYATYKPKLTKFNLFEPAFYGKTECYDFTDDDVSELINQFFNSQPQDNGMC